VPPSVSDFASNLQYLNSLYFMTGDYGLIASQTTPGKSIAEEILTLGGPNWNIVAEGVVGSITNVIFESGLFALTIAYPNTGLYTRWHLIKLFANAFYSTDGITWTLEDSNFTSTSLEYSPFINQYIATSGATILHSPTLSNWKEVNSPNGFDYYAAGNGIWVTTVNNDFGFESVDGQISATTDLQGDNWNVTYDTGTSKFSSYPG
jgi:hypothetical protein